MEKLGASYPWMDLKHLLLEDQQEAMNARREEMLHMAEENGMSESLEEEWCHLLIERDRILKLKVQKENQRILHHHMLTLLQTLITVGHFDHSSTPKPLKSALYNLYTELSTYKSEDSTDHNDNDSNDSFVSEVPVPPPPPPIQEPLQDSRLNPGPEKRFKLDDSDVEENRLGSLRRKTNALSPLISPSYRVSPRNRHSRRTSIKRTPGMRHTPGGKYTPKLLKTPKTDQGPDSEDLRKCLLTGRENLKSTPGLKRSPGGTPQKSKIPTFSDNPNDIVTHALWKKFMNVRRLYGSPIQDAEEKADSREASFNLSID